MPSMASGHLSEQVQQNMAYQKLSVAVRNSNKENKLF